MNWNPVPKCISTDRLQVKMTLTAHVFLRKNESSTLGAAATRLIKSRENKNKH